MKKRLGIIGGMGPMATAYFLRRLTELTDAARDQEHIEALIYSVPTIPDRTAYLLGRSDESPLPVLLRLGSALAAQGAEVLAIPCVTSHGFYAQLSAGISVPVVNALTETADYLAARGVRRVGLMATDGTIKAGVLADALAARGLSAVLPDESHQRDVMRVIYEDVKAGRAPRMPLFAGAAGNLRAQGAEVILLGCTELSIVKRDCALDAGFLDILDVLARASVLTCGGTLTEEELITR